MRILNKNKVKNERGFVLVTSMIFLVIMTGLAVNAIRRSSMDEKSSGNQRAQNLAFQSAERALRFCEGLIELKSQQPGICQKKSGLSGVMATVGVFGAIDDTVHQQLESDGANPQANFPNLWQTQDNWTGATPIATRIANVATDPDFVANVAQQPQCMVEMWNLPNTSGDLKRTPNPAFVITARGVGSTVNAVVWLQETIRCGN
jgi:type IV pilus assembly protein PilX